MVGWHHQLDGYESEQTPGYSEGQGSLVCYSPWGCKESDMTWLLKNNNKPKCGVFPSGLVVRNLPVNAGNKGSIPGPGRSHRPQGN